MKIQEIKNLGKFEEFLRLLSKESLQSMLRVYNLKVSGRKDELINRLLPICKKFGGGIIYSIPSINLFSLIEEDIDDSELRLLLSNKFFPTKKLDVSQDIYENIKNFFNSLNRKSSTEITKQTYIDKDVFILENFIYGIKEIYNVNQYLDNSITSDSIINSMSYSNYEIRYHNEYHYHFPIIYFIYNSINDRRNRNDYYQLITLSKDFFKLPSVLNNMNYLDIKIHETGGTRCISYLENSINFLRQILIINPSKETDAKGNRRRIELTLFGHYLISNIDNKYRNSQMSLDAIYDELFRRPYLFYHNFKDIFSIEVVEDFLNNLESSVEPKLKNKVREYIMTYDSLLASHLEIVNDEEDSIKSIKLNDDDDESVFRKFWGGIKKEQTYYQILNNIFNYDYQDNTLFD